MMNHNINIIQIERMINSSIQQGNDGSQKVVLSENDAADIKSFLSSIDNSVELLQIQNALINNRTNAKNLVQKYYSSLIDKLRTHRITKFEGQNKDNPWGDQVCEKVTQMTPLRNEFFSLFKVIIENDSSEINIPELLQQLVQFNFQNIEFHNQQNIQGHQRNDNYRVFVYELFLYVSAYLLKEQKFPELINILEYKYQVKLVYKENSTNPTIRYHTVLFPQFNYYPPSINNEYRRLRQEIYYDTEHLYKMFLLTRAESNDLISLQDIMEADLLLYFLSLVHTLEETVSHIWQPYFSTNEYGTLDLMLRAVSVQFFNRVKDLFKVNSPEELRNLIIKISTKQHSHPTMVTSFNIPLAEIALNYKDVCTQQ